MRIEYETQLPDLKEWHRFSTGRPFVRRYVIEQRCWKAAFVAFATFIVLFLGLGDFARAFGMAAGTFVVLVLAMWLVDRRQWQMNLEWKMTKCPMLAGLGKRSLTIGDDTLTETSDQFSFTLQWALVERIVHRPRHLFFILLNQSAIVVPLETITPVSDRERFLDFLRRCAPLELRGEIPEPGSPEPPATAIPSK